MAEALGARIAELLASTDEALSTAEIADRLGVPPREVDHAIWARPNQFAWQPGHRWALSAQRRAASVYTGADTEDARAAPLGHRKSIELRAITLTSGVTLRVIQRPIDSSALFTTESRGSELLLVMNSSHPIFASHPMPFAAAEVPKGYKQLLELLLEAWALYEDGVPAGGEHRRLEETRMMWGRRMVQLLSEGE